MIRYGLIGSGMMGQEHIRNVALIEGVEIAALADPDEAMRQAALALQGGTARAVADYRDLLLADACDAYIVCSPNHVHHATLRDLLPLDKPVLCEKPLCTTVDDCRDIVRLQDSRNAPLWVAMEYRFIPAFQRLLAEVGKGTVGPPVAMSIREHRYPFLDKVGAWNRFNRTSGGTLVEKCCHFWDLMRLVLKSDPVRVYASGAQDVNHRDERVGGETPDVIDNAFVVVDFANGTRGMLDLCMFAEGSRWQEVISVTGPKARVDACVPGPARFAAGPPRHDDQHDNRHDDRHDSRHDARLTISDRAARTVRTEAVPVDAAILEAGDHHGSTYYQHLRFRDLVAGRTSRPEVSAEDGLWSVIVGAAAEESVRSGAAIDLRKAAS